ncbi:Porin-like protein NicP [compost metagenome]
MGSFIRAGENTSYGQYSYDFASLGVPGLKASAAYLYGQDIKATNGVGKDLNERETDLRVDYVIQTGALKGFGTTLRHGMYRGNTSTLDQDQTRLIFNYTYAFK